MAKKSHPALLDVRMADLAVLPDGTVLCLYEGKADIVVARFNLEWITAP